MDEQTISTVPPKSIIGFNKKGLLILIVLAAAISILVLLVIRLIAPSSPEPSKPSTVISLKGVSLTPKSFEASDVDSFFQKAIQAGTLISWSGRGDELIGPTSAPFVLENVRSKYGFEPVIIVSNPEKSTLVDFAKKYHPHYLGIGNEIDETFAATFNSLYDAVKVASPQTKIFTVFQLEKLRGLRGGLYGGVNDPNIANWAALNDFNAADFLAFTTYPSLIYKDPADIPTDYYTEITKHTTKQIAFSEVGWFHDGPSGWPSSQDKQAQFINRFFTLTSSGHPIFRIWPFLYDQNVHGVFASMGLLKTTQDTSPAWTEWLAH